MSKVTDFWNDEREELPRYREAGSKLLMLGKPDCDPLLRIELMRSLLVLLPEITAHIEDWSENIDEGDFSDDDAA